jgi:hypothetical protein
MQWLRRLFGREVEAEAGDYLLAGPHWEVRRVHYLGGFFTELGGLLPPGAILYIEGTDLDPELAGYLAARAVRGNVSINQGTMFPEPESFHVLLTPEVAEVLDGLAAQLPLSDVAEHVVAYVGGRVLLEWYDTAGGVLQLASDLDESDVGCFAAAIGGDYSRQR